MVRGVCCRGGGACLPGPALSSLGGVERYFYQCIYYEFMTYETLPRRFCVLVIGWRHAFRSEWSIFYLYFVVRPCPVCTCVWGGRVWMPTPISQNKSS